MIPFKIVKQNGIVSSIELPPRERQQGIIFFNSVGDEDTEAHSRKYGLQLWDYPKEDAFGELYRRYQELQKLEGDEARQGALTQMKADSLLAQDRLFVGKTFDNEVGLFIRDKNGNPRIKIYVDKAGKPRIESLDEKGDPEK